MEDLSPTISIIMLNRKDPNIAIKRGVVGWDTNQTLSWLLPSDYSRGASMNQ